MSKRWLIGILLISFSFNLAILFSFIYFRVVMPPPPAPRDQRMPPPPPEEMRRPRDKELQALHAKFNQTKITLMEELAKDPINETRINAIIDSTVSVQNQLERRLGLRVLEYRKTLTAQEAKEQFQKRAEFLKERSNDFHNHNNNHHRHYRRRR